MPGSQPRRDLLTRLQSSVVRGSYQPPGVPGVWRTVRARQRVEITTGWITPPVVEISGNMLSFPWDSAGDFHVEADFALSAAEAWAGAAAGAPGGGVPFGLYLQAGVGTPGPRAEIQEGLMGVYRNVVQSAAGLAYTYPGGYELHPDDTATVLTTKVVGQVSQTLGNGGPTSIRRIDPADYTFPDGPVWQTPAMISAAPVEVTVPSPPDTDPVPFEFDVVYDEPSGAAMYVTSQDEYAPSGGSWGWDVPDWSFALVEAVGPGGHGDAPQWVATVQPARYRITLSPSEWVPDLLGNFYWDAGLYLPSDFASLAGYPTTLPPGAAELDFYILGPGVDWNDTWPDWYLAYVYSGGNGVDSSGITTPIAGSHLWVYYDVGGSTPADPPNPPATYVPATLASGGTA